MAEVRLSIRCEAEDKARWEAMAKGSNQKLATLVRDLLNLEERLVAEGKPSLHDIAARFETALELSRQEGDIPARFFRTILSGGQSKG